MKPLYRLLTALQRVDKNLRFSTSYLKLEQLQVSDKFGNLISMAKQGDFKALAQLLTKLDRTGPQASFAVPDIANPPQETFRLGITGPPGAGKSTLVGHMIGLLRQKGLKVAVLAVDPSSPISQGAILGDRIRYSDHFNDPGVFIRSVGTRGGLGGLSASSYLMLRAFDLAKFDLVIIETVGVGQTELEVMNVADFITVLFVPESGDSVQAMKAGLTEIADMFVINKSDRPGAEAVKMELEATLALGESSKPYEICMASANVGKGVPEILESILKAKAKFKGRNAPSRMVGEAKALLRWTFEKELAHATEGISNRSDLSEIVSKSRIEIK